MNQVDRIKNILDRQGSISRNEALNMRITRLGSIIHLLNKQGNNFKGRFVKGDYVYTKRELPKYQRKLL